MQFQKQILNQPVISGIDMDGNEITFTPASVRMCYSLALKDGTLISIFQAKYDSGADEALATNVLMRSKDGGRTWGETRILKGDVKELQNETYDVPFFLPIYDEIHDTLILNGYTRHWKSGFEKEGLIHELDFCFGRAEARYWSAKSTDGGLTWSPITETQAIPYGAAENWTFSYPGPGVGIQLKHQKDPAKNGRMIFPGVHYILYDDGVIEIDSHLRISDDFGDSWSVGAITKLPHNNECSVTELSDGTIVLNCRNGGDTNLRIQSISLDGGDTFVSSELVETLYDPVCHAGFASAPINGRDYLFLTLPTGELGEPFSWYDVYPVLSRWGDREALMLYASTDKGTTWKAIKQISEKGVLAAYSCLCVTHEGKLLCEWESGPDFRHEYIQYTLLDLDELVKLCDA